MKIRLSQNIQALRASLALIQNNDQINRLDETMIKYQSFISKSLRNKGKVWTVQHFKKLHLVATQYVLNDTLSVIPFCITDKSGLPKQLSPIKWLLISDDPMLTRLGLTITRSFEQLILKPTWDPSSITQAGVELDTNLLQRFSIFVQGFVTRTNIRNRRIYNSENLKCALTKGPYGPSVMTSHFDAKAIVNNPDLCRIMQDFAHVSGQQELFRHMQRIGSQPFDFNPKTPPARISLIAEPGGKTRIIAIADFWTQNFLQGLHDNVMQILKKRFITNGTYDQDNQFTRCVKESLGKDTFSVDLSKATDRFPIELQRILLAEMFGEKYAQAWVNLMTKRCFSSPDGPVRWKVGQPLGLLSSWAIFSLTHHAFVEFCASEVGHKSFKRYSLLGDDIVIWDKEVALKYIDLCKDIGVAVALDKSHISRNNSTTYLEFAKRIAKGGTELTGIRFNVMNRSHTLHGFLDLMNALKHWNWPIDWSRISVPPTFLKRRAEHLEILLYELSDGRRALPAQAMLDCKGNVITIDSDSLIQKLRKKVLHLRIDSLKEKLSTLFSDLDGQKPIQTLFEREGIAFTDKLIGLSGYDPLDLHPVVLELNKVGMDLISAMSVLESFEDSSSYPEMMPLEYLPYPTMEPYFGDRFILKQKFRNTMVLTSWYEIIEEINQQQSASELDQVNT